MNGSRRHATDRSPVASLTTPSRGTLRPPWRSDRLANHAQVYRRAVLQVLPVWIAARVVVVAALVVAHNIVTVVRPGNAGAALRVHQGLLAWDGGWYQSIAEHGYASSGRQSLRFFPAYPMAARVLGWIPGISAGAALVVIANLCALAAMAALVVLVRHDSGDAALARRSAWLLGLAPAAYTLVLGYADAALLLCSIVTLLAARTGRWWWAAAAGLVAGLVRPVGILLVVPVLVEVCLSYRAGLLSAAGSGGETNGTSIRGTAWGTARATTWGTARRRSQWPARGAALVAPVFGTGIYLTWVNAQFGDAWLPFRVQQQSGHRGAVTVPLSSMWHNVVSVFHGHHVGSALHIPWVVLSLMLLVVAFRRLPLSYGLFAAAVLAVSVTSSNLDSFERYALGAFPLVVAASTFTSKRQVEVVVLVLAALGMVGYALLAFLGTVVP